MQGVHRGGGRRHGLPLRAHRRGSAPARQFPPLLPDARRSAGRCAATPCGAPICASSGTPTDCRRARRGTRPALDPAVTREGDRILIDGEEIARATGPLHGIAMDLGTTTVVLRLFDLESGEQIADTSFENPQRFGGSDVMARISYDGEHRGLLMRTLAGYLTPRHRRPAGGPARPSTKWWWWATPPCATSSSARACYTIGQNPYRSITEIEMAEGTRAEHQPGVRRAPLPAAHSSAGARLRPAHSQRTRGRGRRRLHAGRRHRARRAHRSR